MDLIVVYLKGIYIHVLAASYAKDAVLVGRYSVTDSIGHVKRDLHRKGVRVTARKLRKVIDSACLFPRRRIAGETLFR